MFLWRNLDPRTLTSVLDWMAERQRRKSEPARPAAAPPRPVPDDRRAHPARFSRRDDAQRR
jgi:hypothetical protein